jgi:hypothetical protein
MIDQRNNKTQWTCTPHSEFWMIKALQMVHGIGVRCEVELPRQPLAMQLLPDMFEQMTDAIAVEKVRVLEWIERNHKDALEEQTEVAVEKGTQAPTRH